MYAKALKTLDLPDAFPPKITADFSNSFSPFPKSLSLIEKVLISLNSLSFVASILKTVSL